jgi:hypothetical protein
MILVKLKGGLGNQMFQYAFGRRMAIQNSDELRLDIAGLRKTAAETKRDYALGVFAIHADIAGPEETAQIKYPYGLLSKAMRFIDAKVFRKFHVQYDPKITTQTGDMYLDGFFQDERYFKDIESTLRKEFALKDRMSDPARLVAEQIAASENSVSLHIRRGDYVTDAKTNAHHGTCGPEYYADAIAFLRDKVDPCSFFIFSDDIAWVKENMSIENATYVSSPEIQDYEELILMSMCEHNIIANSTFSWWGAWLNAHEGKIVIAPRQWTTKSTSDDIIPPSWTRI